MKRAIFLAALALSACATAQEAMPPQAQQAPASPAPWWSSAGDAQFQSVLAFAGQAADAREAQARLIAAQARLDAARASLWPELSLGLSSTAIAADTGGFDNSQAYVTGNVSRNLAGADGFRVDESAALARQAQAQANQARLTSRTTAALLYNAYRTAQTQRAAAEQSLAAAEESLSIANTRTRAGLEGGLAVAQAQSARDRAAAVLPALRQAQIEAEQGLTALLATTNAPIAALLAGDAPPPQLATIDPQSLPADVLTLRPDVQSALAAFDAATAAGRAAAADRWPRVSLAALIQATDASLGTTGETGSLTASLLGPIFDAGRRQALSRAAQANAQAAESALQGVIAESLADVRIATARKAQADAALAARQAAVTSAQEEARLARDRYTRGLTSFLAVTVADTTLATAQSQAASAQGAAADAAVQLAQALGLGVAP
ncbi:MAG: TolC family protein [Caulobacterales bacterium]|jgi:multidrug efflux system outer membrane protein